MEGTGNQVKNGMPPQGAALEANRYVLPPWRMSQIVAEVFSAFCEGEFHRDDFDYKRMICSTGIRLTGFSSFAKENLEELKSVSPSLWDEGLCLAFPNEKTGETCRMIAFNDIHAPAETRQIILHEFGHLRLRHTQQSINGEAEATCFAIAMTVLLLLERRLHIRDTIVQKERKRLLFQKPQQNITSKEVS